MGTVTSKDSHVVYIKAQEDVENEIILKGVRDFAMKLVKLFIMKIVKSFVKDIHMKKLEESNDGDSVTAYFNLVDQNGKEEKKELSLELKTDNTLCIVSVCPKKHCSTLNIQGFCTDHLQNLACAKNKLIDKLKKAPNCLFTTCTTSRGKNLYCPNHVKDLRCIAYRELEKILPQPTSREKLKKEKKTDKSLCTIKSCVKIKFPFAAETPDATGICSGCMIKLARSHGMIDHDSQDSSRCQIKICLQRNNLKHAWGWDLCNDHFRAVIEVVKGYDGRAT